MGKKIEHEKYGLIYERHFSGIEVDEHLHKALEKVRSLDHLIDYQLEAGDLTVQRRWIEGQDPREFFRTASIAERKKYSVHVFRGVFDKLGQLGGCGHGALHPGNVILAASVEVLDPVANQARLGTSEVPSSEDLHVWVWRSRMPPGWDVADWDLVGLLRTAALLAQGPSLWEEPLGDSDTVALCRSWVAETLQHLPAGSDIGQVLEEAAAKLDLIVDVPPPPLEVPSLLDRARIVESLLEDVHRYYGGRMLRRAEEEKVSTLAAEQGLSPAEISDFVAVWLAKKGFKRERDLREVAQSFLDAGRYPKSQMVRKSACQNALRTFTGHGVEEKEAKRQVLELLEASSFLDEREKEKGMSERLRHYLANHCKKKQYRPRHLTELVRIVESFGLPKDLAKRRVHNYLYEQGFQLKPGVFS